MPWYFKQHVELRQKSLSCLGLSSFVSSSRIIAVEIADHQPVFSLVYDLNRSPILDSTEIWDFQKVDKIAFQNTLRIQTGSLYIIIVVEMKVCRDSFAFLIRSTFEIIKIKNLVTGVLRKSIKIRSQLYMADSQ